MLRPSVCSRRIRSPLFSLWLPPARTIHTSPAVSRTFVKGKGRGSRPFTNTDETGLVQFDTPSCSVEEARRILNQSLYYWSKQKPIRDRLECLGLSSDTTRQLLRAFVFKQPKEGYFPPSQDSEWQMDRIAGQMAEYRPVAIDKALSRRLFHWVTSHYSNTAGILSPAEIHRITLVLQSVDCSHPEEWYPSARRLKRKFVLHVGPTNSGKTHHALRALAAAKRGVYAGPLRLLAHEVFERLNKGDIVAAGADPQDPPSSHVRACNLVTGEEQKITDPLAGLVSCTVEMLNLMVRWDVAVIDEIQMMTDVERGGSWTQAVLGLSADEIHLCGEESVVPLIQEMLKKTGDEVVVNRYKRLTPLSVGPKSLNGDLAKVEKGDCIVTFSRMGIFRMKREVERTTGMRCAVVYGRLPSEVRSGQAALFNDSESGYDVLIGSDALGMGLNLKIKRMIFQSVHKFNGQGLQLLSLSQIKQIAGRAGRFGLHGPDSSGGVTTTLRENDLPILQQAMAQPILSNPRAVLPYHEHHHREIEQLLSAKTPFSKVFDLRSTLSKLNPSYMMPTERFLKGSMGFIDTSGHGLTLGEKITMLLAPVQWRDESAERVMTKFVNSYREEVLVNLNEILSSLGLLTVLEKVLDLKKVGLLPDSLGDDLETLETLHKSIMCYMWLSFRFPLGFQDRERAEELKTMTEEAIAWCLSDEAKKGSKKTERKRVGATLNNRKRRTKVIGHGPAHLGRSGSPKSTGSLASV